MKLSSECLSQRTGHGKDAGVGGTMPAINSTTSSPMEADNGAVDYEAEPTMAPPLPGAFPCSRGLRALCAVVQVQAGYSWTLLLRPSFWITHLIFDAKAAGPSAGLSGDAIPVTACD